MTYWQMYVLGMVFTAGAIVEDYRSMSCLIEFDFQSIIETVLAITLWPVFWFFQMLPKDDDDDLKMG